MTVLLIVFGLVVVFVGFPVFLGKCCDHSDIPAPRPLTRRPNIDLVHRDDAA